MHISGIKHTQLSVCVLASGSKGNSVYISDGTTSVLIDAGLSGTEIKRRLNHRGLSPEKISAVLVTHEHSDHIRGAGILSKKYGTPIYMNSKTAVAAVQKIGKIRCIRHFECGTPFMINSLRFHPFSVSHDASDTTGFAVSFDGKKIGIATDLGFVTEMVKNHLTGCNALILEANHDSEMLINGPYPWHLKQRVKGRTGHLSNTDTKALLQEIKHENLAHVVLTHLSEINNTPEKALTEILPVFHETQTHITVADQYESSEIFRI